MTVSVIVPTYKRLTDLKKCIEALNRQSRIPDEVLIVVRESDAETLKFFSDEKFLAKTVIVGVGGQVAALNSGLAVATGDIVIFIDDDTAPHPDWLERIVGHFDKDPAVGGVGGRDVIQEQGTRGKEQRAKGIEHREKQIPTMPSALCPMPLVGKITWYGRIVGNHHLGEGGAREADHLKGTNMAFRRDAIKGLSFDTRLRGSGAEYRNDLAMSLAVKNRGWKLVYAPEVKVDHYYAQRYDEDKRGEFDEKAIFCLAHNDILVVLDYMRVWRRFSCLLYLLLFSNIATPGILQVIRMMLLRKGDHPWARFVAGMRGRGAGLKTWLVTKEHRAEGMEQGER